MLGQSKKKKAHLVRSLDCDTRDMSLEDLYYKRFDRKQTTLSHNYTHTKKKKKKQQLPIHTITGMCTGSMI